MNLRRPRPLSISSSTPDCARDASGTQWTLTSAPSVCQSGKLTLPLTTSRPPAFTAGTAHRDVWPTTGNITVKGAGSPRRTGTPCWARGGWKDPRKGNTTGTASHSWWSSTRPLPACSLRAIWETTATMRGKIGVCSTNLTRFAWIKSLRLSDFVWGAGKRTVSYILHIRVLWCSDETSWGPHY